MSGEPSGIRRRIGILRKLVVGCGFGAFLALCTLEILLRICPDMLSGGLADQVYSNYRATPGGIYFTIRDLPMRFCWPDFTTQMYSHGYRWTHTTDHLGFRNPPAVATDLLLLGDSQIYGHGVEEPDTVAAVLRQRYHRGAYNMARQGDCLQDSYILTRLFLNDLRPKKVALVVFLNDFKDLLQYKNGRVSTAEMGWDYATLRKRRDDPAEWRTGGSQLDRLLVWRLAQGLSRARGRTAPPPPSRGPFPKDGSNILSPERFALAGTYYQAVLPGLDADCKAAGAKLYVIYLTWGRPVSANFDARAAEFLSEVCAENEIAFADTRELITEDLLLPGDGHLSPRGHAVLAEWLDAHLGK